MAMEPWFFVSDLHGQLDRYQKLFKAVLSEKPQAVFLGGDLLPSGVYPGAGTIFNNVRFIQEIMIGGFLHLREALKDDYPRVFIILGNDDPMTVEEYFVEESGRLWEYMNCRRVELGSFVVYGYPYVPPTPFLIKDWERYDISRYVDPGCISPEEGWRSAPIPDNEARHRTIQMDLKNLTGDQDLSNAVFLFHTPPYQTDLDQVAQEGRMVDGVRTDTHVGSLAVRRLIESRQPLITLHGHIHESARLTGSWRVRIGRTLACSAAYDGNELALIRLSPDSPETASRELI